MADCFSACILIPEDWARNIWPEVKDVKRMAEIFEVPMQTMYIQLKWMGLL
jgi:Zn-dependent peptidase ImmA (M78 family)